MLRLTPKKWIGIFLLSLLGSHSGWSGSYGERPDILSVEPSNHTEEIRSITPTWEALREAHLETVAQLLGAYPDQEIYFLARDGELLYDTAKALLQSTGNSGGLNRIHLINVSRRSKDDPNLREYLKQEGVSNEALSSGKRFVFVDTGFYGSISKHIQRACPKNGNALT